MHSSPARAELDELWPEIYSELRRLAESQMKRERGGHTLQTTALVHEAYLRLTEQRSLVVQNREQFLAVAAHAIRRILIDHARARSARKAREQLSVEAGADFTDGPESKSVDLIALDDALHKLAQLSERQSKVVELRYFGGLSVDETAGVLGVSPRTVDGEWSVARAWLSRELRGERTA